MDTGTVCICGLGGIISTISKKWALLIINRLGLKGRLRFSDLMDELAGISPKTLSDTLKELQEENLVGRESFPEVPPRVEYFLTEEGERVTPGNRPPPRMGIPAGQREVGFLCHILPKALMFSEKRERKGWNRHRCQIGH
ncbi:MAG: helix-turn-helix transcriptional regulator [Methanolinea sp.]|nr:helix-turn-helix transcriptional regulator [Methanolinea sp.]